MVEASRFVSRFVVWPGAFACCGVAGMLLEPLMGQPPPPDGLFDLIGHPSACAILAAAVVAAAAAADA